jgi:acetyltransferase-like isoleucine patch superfamily enzyme
LLGTASPGWHARRVRPPASDRDIPVRDLLAYARRNGPGIVRGATELKARATTCGSWCELRGHVRIRSGGTLHIGNKLKVDGRPIATLIQVGSAGRLSIGDDVYINYGVDILASHSVTLGDNVLIGPLCAVVDDDMHDLDSARKRRQAPIVVESNVWLARGVIVMPGVTIGRDTVVAAGSIVSRSLPAGVLAAGAPARVIRDVTIEDGWRRH